ncbi:Uncharacterised protein [Mycobacteroides abscessus subsp. abscessus]|nr:Uncharacterised protein [Mycobacteroides abscessus subsp. abscessus]
MASLPAGIQVGLGSPWPCLLSRRRQNSVFLVKVVIELSRCCMTSAITVRSLHCVTLNIRNVPRQSARAFSISWRHLDFGPSPSVIRVCSRPIALEPLP